MKKAEPTPREAAMQRLDRALVKASDRFIDALAGQVERVLRPHSRKRRHAPA